MRLVGSLALALGLLLGSCQGPGRYGWAGYEDSVYSVTINPAEADVDAEIVRLNETLQRTADKGQLVPPGLHAHLGLLYSLAGDTGNATAAFLAEKELYPESATFIDGVLARAQMGN